MLNRVGSGKDMLLKSLFAWFHLEKNKQQYNSSMSLLTTESFPPHPQAELMNNVIRSTLWSTHNHCPQSR